jgi:two-component system, LytTR family, response regulator LytT
MRIVIVEDEPLIARRLERYCRELLGPHLHSLQLLPEFDEASAWIDENPIDLLVLDLNLRGRDGMTLLQRTVAGAFHTIIVSANTDQALRAFEFGVLDFVPKPFDRDRFAAALRRATGESGRTPYPAQRLAVRRHGRLELIAVSDLLYVQGADNYTELVLHGGRRVLHDKTLEKLEAVLPDDFERIHKSYLVRLSAVKQLHVHAGSQCTAELATGEVIPVGRTRYKALRERLGR